MRTLLAIVLSIVGAAAAHGSVISKQGNSLLAPNLANQQMTLLISGTDFYTDANLVLTVNGGIGPAPAITLVFNDPAAAIPGGNLVGSVWQNGNGGIFAAPNGTTVDSSGLNTVAFFVTPGATPQNTAGIILTMTISTVGVPPGDYNLDLTGSTLFNGLDDEFNPIPVPLSFQPIHILGVPEPSTYALAIAGVVGLLVFRRRTR
jgi:hypothetical protein